MRQLGDVEPAIRLSRYIHPFSPSANQTGRPAYSVPLRADVGTVLSTISPTCGLSSDPPGGTVANTNLCGASPTKAACTTGANGQPCENGGIPDGYMVQGASDKSGCSCRCFGWGGNNCETALSNVECSSVTSPSPSTGSVSDPSPSPSSVSGGPSAGQSPSSSTRIPANTPSPSSGKGSGGASGSPSSSPSSASGGPSAGQSPSSSTRIPADTPSSSSGKEVEVLADHPHRRRALQAEVLALDNHPHRLRVFPRILHRLHQGRKWRCWPDHHRRALQAEVLALDNHPHRRPPKKLLMWENITEWTRLRHAGCQCFWLCSCLHFGTHRRLLLMNICNTQRHPGRDCAAQKITTLAARWRTREKVNNKLECNG